jgi:hypothetical protein
MPFFLASAAVMDLAVVKLEGSGRLSSRTESYSYSVSAILDIFDMNLSNTACVLGISKSAPSCISGVLSSMTGEVCAGGL